jgi:hypothetical protein
MAAVFAFLGTNFFVWKILGLRERFLMCFYLISLVSWKTVVTTEQKQGYEYVIRNAITECVCYGSIHFFYLFSI